MHELAVAPFCSTLILVRISKPPILFRCYALVQIELLAAHAEGAVICNEPAAGLPSVALSASRDWAESFSVLPALPMFGVEQ